ncbi:hypothetical protein [Niabella aquatica]
MNRLTLLLISCIFFVFSCKKDKDTPASTPPTEPPAKETKYTITSDGGIIDDKATGVIIEIPKNAVDQNVNFTITKNIPVSANLDFIGGNSYPPVGDILKIDMEGREGLDSCAIVTIPYNSNSISNLDALGIAYYSDALKKWIPADVLKIETNSHKIKFYTTHFSDWALFDTKLDGNLLSSINTRFSPAIDGFSIINNFPSPYNKASSTGSNTIGNCVGFSALSILYFLYKKDATGMGLYKYSYRGRDPNIYSPALINNNYDAIYKGVNKTSKHLNTYLDAFWSSLIKKDFFDYTSINSINSAKNIYNALNTLKQPVFLAIADENRTNKHAVVVYKYDKDLKTFYYYDPNIPDIEKKFTHNLDGSINTFSYADRDLNAKYLNVSTSLGGGLTIEYADNIFNTYFILPTNLTSEVSTTSVNGITSNTATSGGTVSYDGGSPVTARGVCWNISPNPTIANGKTIDGTGTGLFESSINGLTPNTKYYVRAYATNANGTAYGEEVNFTTLGAPVPKLVTKAISDIDATSAVSGGTILAEVGVPTATARGVCWSTSPNPTIANSKTSDGTGPGSFTSNITGLTPDTKYYVRAYATNANGTGYGSERIFTTEKKDLALSKTSISVLSGKSEFITITSGSGKYGVKSSNTNIATASVSGNSITITGKNEGSATISVHDSLLVQTKTIAVTVTPFTIVPLSVSKDAVGVNVGQSETISIIQGSGDYTLIPGNANITNVWQLNATTIKITGISAGNTSFIIKDDKSGQQVTVSVTVAAMAEMVITPESIALNAGESKQATITNGMGPYTFIIANTAIASVTQSGSILTIKGLTAGQTTISVRDFGTGQSKVINVTVSGGSSGIKWEMVEGSDHHSLGIKSDGSLWGWGESYFIGNSAAGGIDPFPVRVGTASDWKQVVTGPQYSLGIRSDGSLWAWGTNNFGELGDGTNTSRNVPMRIGTANDWKQVVAGYYHSLGIKSDGSLWAWGDNSYGELGDGTNTNRNVPVRVGTASDWKQVVAGYYHSLGIRSDGSLWAWGFNLTGTLHDGSDPGTKSSNIPVRISTVTDWKQVAAGLSHNLGIKSDGSLWAWGYNSYGELGDGTNTNRNVPVRVGTASDWKQVVGGNQYSLGIKSDGSLWGWGFNAYGQLGDGTATHRNIPVRIGTASDWKQVVGCYQHSLSIKSDGSLWGWGWSAFLGIGHNKYSDFFSQLVPLKISD